VIVAVTKMFPAIFQAIFLEESITYNGFCSLNLDNGGGNAFCNRWHKRPRAQHHTDYLAEALLLLQGCQNESCKTRHTCMRQMERCLLLPA
jgi:hypothetical protein